MPRVSVETKELIMRDHYNGVSTGEIARRYNVHPDTARKIIKSAKEPKLPRSRSRSMTHRPKKLSQEMVDTVKEWIDQDASITFEDIVSRISNQFNITIHRDTIKRYTAGFYYSFDRSSSVPRNTPEDIETRLEYAKMFEKMDQFSDKIIFIDETDINVHTRLNGYQNLDFSRAVCRRSKHLSICAAMTHKSLVFYNFKEIDFETFDLTNHLKDFIDNLASNEITNAWILMGKAGLEQMEAITDLFSETQHEILFMPPCAPFLNPIENFFRQLRNYVKKVEPKSSDEVFFTLQRMPDFINENECQKYYQTMKTYIQRCLAEQVIVD